MADVIFAQGKRDLDETDWESGNVKAALMKNSYTPNATTQTHWDDISSDECDATDYTAGGTALTSTAVTLNGANAEYDAADVTWNGLGGATNNTLRHVVVYYDTGTPSTSYLIQSFDFGSDKTTADADFTVQWPDPILTVS